MPPGGPRCSGLGCPAAAMLAGENHQVPANPHEPWFWRLGFEYFVSPN